MILFASGVAPGPEAAPSGGPLRENIPDSVPPTNRLRAVLLHVPFYSVDGPARLAADVRVSRSTITRLLGGKRTPSPRLARRIGRALSRRLGRTVSVKEVFRAEGKGYLTPRVCDLCGTCGPGCLPPHAWNERTHRLKPEWRDARPGDWCTYPAPPLQNEPLTANAL